MAVKPSKIGHIRNKKNKHGKYKHDLSAISNKNHKTWWHFWGSKRGKHLQSIVLVGDEYTVLSSSVKDIALILVHKKKIVQVESFPKDKNYEHAGGLGVLDVKNGKNGENRWMIVVPVFKGDQGAILRYFLSEGKGNKAQLTDRKEIIELPTKAYAAGIARNGNSVVMAVGIDKKGNKVQFWTCTNGKGWDKDWGVWDAIKAKKNGWIKKENGWIDENWARYPNSISLIEHDGQIYFVGLNGSMLGEGRKEWVDIYSVNQAKDADKKRLIKVGKAQVTRDAKERTDPSFRWGGSARMQKIQNRNAQKQDEVLEVLAVEYGVHNNCSIKYNKFCFKIDPNENNQLVPC